MANSSWPATIVNVLQNRSVFRAIPEKEWGLQHFRYVTPQFFPERRLPEYAVVCCFAGRIEVWENSVQSTLLPGEILVGNPGLWRGSQYLPVDGICEGATAVVGAKAMQRLLQELRLAPPGKDALVLDKMAAPGLVRQMRRVVDTAGHAPPGLPIYLDGFLQQFLVEVLWAWPAAAILPRSPIPGHYLSRRHFVHAVEYMNRCAKHEFTVDALCDRIGISLPHFRRLMQSSAQRSPLEFYHRVLIRRAEKMIGDQLDPKSVSEQLGFSTMRQFSRIFRLVLGCTPFEYQERCLARSRNVRVAPLILSPK